MNSGIDWIALQAFSEKVTKSGNDPANFLADDWEAVRVALAKLEKEEDHEGIIKLRNMYNDLLARDSLWGSQIIQDLDALSINSARKTGNMTELGHYLGSRGHNFHRQGFHQKAIAAFTESYKVYFASGQKKQAIRSYYMTSLCYRALNQRDKAKDILQHVLSQLDENDPWQGNPKQVLAWIMQDEGKISSAEQLLSEALVHFQMSENSDILIAGACTDLGEIMSLQHKYIESNDYFQRSLSIYQNYLGQYNRQEARTLLKIAESYMRQKDFNKAYDLLSKADQLISMQGHYYDLMWRIEIANVIIFAHRRKFKNMLLKLQMVFRYRKILGLSNWYLVKQFIERMIKGIGLPR